MELRELSDLIQRSTSDDWNTITSAGYTEQDHHIRAVFRPDLSVGMAWGARLHDQFEEPWATGFPDPKASAHFLDLTYNGFPVDRMVRVSVDGHRCGLPLPTREPSDAKRWEDVTGWWITPWQADVFRLVQRLEHTYDFDEYLSRAGIEVRR